MLGAKAESCTQHYQGWADHLSYMPCTPPIPSHLPHHLRNQLSSLQEWAREPCYLFLPPLLSTYPSKGLPEFLIWPLINCYFLGSPGAHICNTFSPSICPIRPCSKQGAPQDRSCLWTFPSLQLPLRCARPVLNAFFPHPPWLHGYFPCSFGCKRSLASSSQFSVSCSTCRCMFDAFVGEMSSISSCAAILMLVILHLVVMSS